MSSDDKQFPSDYVDRIMKKDDEIVERMESAHGDPDMYYRLSKERLDLYDGAGKMPIDRITKINFSLVKSDILRDVAIFKLRKDFDQQISQVISRLDGIDDDIKTLKDKLNFTNK
ncbi:MAG TPA: hypothetical protein VFR94_02855 [Nitrososphaeraceae archaeon]|nr:hypothetical protein [Nitrososphaeraceae archaeon]